MKKIIKISICILIIASFFIGNVSAINVSTNKDEFKTTTLGDGPLEFLLEVDEVGHRHYVLTLSAKNKNMVDTLNIHFNSGIAISIWREGVKVSTYKHSGSNGFESTFYPSDDKILLRTHWYGRANTEDGKIKFGYKLPEGTYNIVGYCPAYMITSPYPAYYEMSQYNIDPVDIDLPESRSKTSLHLNGFLQNILNIFKNL